MTQERVNSSGVPVGGGQHLSPAEFLLMAGFLTYRAHLAPIAARVAARRVLDAILAAAAAHGFADSDALETMMACTEKPSGMRELAEEAAAAVGDTVACLDVIRCAGVTLEADS